MLLVLLRMFLKDSNFLLFWKMLIKPPNELSGFFFSFWLGHFLSFLLWTGLDLETWLVARGI